jgi:hypothetical protein
MRTIKKHDLYKIKIKTPDPVTYNTGDQQPAYEKKDEFFSSIADKIIPDKKKQAFYFKTEIYNLGAITKREITAKGTQYPESDDKLWALIYHDRIIAGMIEARTDMNWINFTYFQNLENLLGCPIS